MGCILKSSALYRVTLSIFACAWYCFVGFETHQSHDLSPASQVRCFVFGDQRRHRLFCTSRTTRHLVQCAGQTLSVATPVMPFSIGYGSSIAHMASARAFGRLKSGWILWQCLSWSMLVGCTSPPRVVHSGEPRMLRGSFSSCCEEFGFLQ